MIAVSKVFEERSPAGPFKDIGLTPSRPCPSILLVFPSIHCVLLYNEPPVIRYCNLPTELLYVPLEIISKLTPPTNLNNTL